MTWDPVPWCVGGGAVHSSEVGRLVTYLATGGRQGVLLPTDLLVTPMTVPGQGVFVSPGACVILNRAAGAAYDSYVARMPSQDTVATTPNGAAGPRSDLVIARVENPFISGEPWSPPSDVTVGPYIFTRVVSNVPPGTKSVDALNLGYTAIPLARIDFPVSTGTVTAAMIQDLRSVVNLAALTSSTTPGADGDNGGEPPNFRMVWVPLLTNEIINWTQQTFVDWPVQSNWVLRFPAWSTYIEFDLRLNNVFIKDGNAWGEIRLLINGQVASTSNFDFNFTPNDPQKCTFTIGGGWNVPQSLRGKSATCKLQLRYLPEPRNVNGNMHADLTSYTSGIMMHYSRPSAV
jgi:hypothetical protein